MVKKIEIKEKGLLLFHQGWTDIINSLPFINFFQGKYKNLQIIMRDSSNELIDFYISQFNNVSVDYYPLEQIDFSLEKILEKYQNYDFNIIGVNDFYRYDEYKNKFRNSFNDTFFVEKFYKCYNIDYFEKINSFNFKRNKNIEDSTYDKFVSEHGSNYVLTHNDVDRNLMGFDFTSNLNYVDLNKKTNQFFDYIKILENAKEIFLIDSVWASFIFLLDCKYQLFHDKKITVKCLRGYKEMFEEPIKLKNWVVL